MIRIRLQEIAKEKGLTQAQIAEMSDLAPNTIRGYIYNQVQRPDLEVLDTLCRVLNIGLHELLEYKADEPSPELMPGAA